VHTHIPCGSGNAHPQCPSSTRARQMNGDMAARRKTSCETCSRSGFTIDTHRLQDNANSYVLVVHPSSQAAVYLNRPTRQASILCCTAIPAGVRMHERMLDCHHYIDTRLERWVGKLASVIHRVVRAERCNSGAGTRA
jgi:hypothetical protein